MSVKKDIVERARQLGFDSCRIADCAPSTHGEAFRGWLRDGAAGEMQWLERGADKR